MTCCKMSPLFKFILRYGIQSFPVGRKQPISVIIPSEQRIHHAGYQNVIWKTVFIVLTGSRVFFEQEQIKTGFRIRFGFPDFDITQLFIEMMIPQI